MITLKEINDYFDERTGLFVKKLTNMVRSESIELDKVIKCGAEINLIEDLKNYFNSQEQE